MIWGKMLLENREVVMKKFNRKAFTLIEMLVVVIVLGVILAIAIPSVRNLINQNRNRKYQVHMSIVEEKTKLFIDRYHGELESSSANCFQIDYQDLLDQDFITEQDVYCRGSIIIRKNSDDFEAEYYLSCVDQNDDSLHESSSVPTGCTIFVGN